MADMLGVLELAIDDLDAHKVGELLPPRRRGAPAIVRDSDGQPLLNRAIFASDASRPDESLAIVRALLAAGANPAECEPETRETALHVVASKLKREPPFAVGAVEMLLEHLDEHPDELCDAEGLTPLAVVVGQGRTLSPAGDEAAGDDAMAQVAGLLIERGCCVGAATHASGAAAHGFEPNAAALPPTILHVAAEWAPPSVIDALLRAADVEHAMAVADRHGDGPMQVALGKGRRRTAAAMLEAFPDACEGPWGARGSQRVLGVALHRMIATAARSPGAALLKPDYAG